MMRVKGLMRFWRSDSLIGRSDMIQSILKNAKTIAVVGLSDKPHRDSYKVAAYMQQHGFRIIPVNPNLVEVLGETAYPDLLSIPCAVDIVNLFQNSTKVPPFVDDAIAIKAKAVWMQLGIVHQQASKKAQENGLDVVMDKCLKIEHQCKTQ